MSASGLLTGQLAARLHGSTALSVSLEQTVNRNPSLIASSNSARLTSSAAGRSTYPPFTPRVLATRPAPLSSLRIFATNGRLRANRPAISRALPPAGVLAQIAKN